MRIHNIEQLAAYVGVPSCFQGDYAKAVERAVFKYTECGCTFTADADGVTVSGYAEGADAECEVHRLYFPFDGDYWDAALEEADYEGCQMWHEWNDDEWCDVYPDDVMEDDNRQRAADMNATLRGGW